VVDLGLRGLALGLLAQRHLPVDQLDAVELLAKALVDAEQEVRVVGDVARGPALLAEHLGPHLAVAADRFPAGLRRQVGVGVPAPEGKGAPAGHDRPASGDGGHALGVGAGEVQRLPDHPVPGRRARAGAVDVVGSQAVHHHDDHIHRVRRSWLALEAGRLVLLVAR
jgi:hypothetical protein